MEDLRPVSCDLFPLAVAVVNAVGISILIQRPEVGPVARAREWCVEKLKATRFVPRFGQSEKRKAKQAGGVPGACAVAPVPGGAAGPPFWAERLTQCEYCLSVWAGALVGIPSWWWPQAGAVICCLVGGHVLLAAIGRGKK